MFNLHKLREVFFFFPRSLEKCVFIECWEEPYLNPFKHHFTLGTIYLGHYPGEDARCILDSLDPPEWPFHPQGLWVRSWPLKITQVVRNSKSTIGFLCISVSHCTVIFFLHTDFIGVSLCWQIKGKRWWALCVTDRNFARRKTSYQHTGPWKSS